MAACPNCASPLRDGLRFCTQCGTPLHSAARAEHAATPSPDPFVESPPEAEFDPVPALGPNAPEPIARPTILGLLATPSPASAGAEHEDNDSGDDAVPGDGAAHEEDAAHEDDATHEEESAAPEASPVAQHASSPSPHSSPSPPSPPSPQHPLGVPVISARQAQRPGANPTHIGRASSYITAPPFSADTQAGSPPESIPPPASIPEPASPSVPSPPFDRRSAGRTSSRRYAPPPARSTAATWALVTGLLPLLVSIFGNAVTTELGTQALEATASGVTSGAWAPVFVALSLVFVANAALLTVCAITGVRGIRETSNGITRGRPLAVSGLAAGAVNVVLLVAGLVISISGLSAVLG